ncbi:MAG: hypothetical protein ACE14P_00185 [Methanotrichaceae archaeon]
MRLLHRSFIRGIEGYNLVEIFCVVAVASVLGIRFFLVLTGYPQLSGRGLHIAHVLLGGFLMMIALIIALAYINKSASYLVAVLGGIGFGAFIDELGKFITGDNNYFFRPTIALIYITFILIYLAVETFIHRHDLTEQEKLVNALEIAKEVALSDLDHIEKERALRLLDACDPSSPVVKALKGLLCAIEAVPARDPDIYTVCKMYIHSVYGKITQRRWFMNTVLAFFVLQSLLTFVADGFILYVVWRGSSYMAEVVPDSFQVLSFSNLAMLTSATFAALLVFLGMSRIRKNKIAAYRLFRSAILIQIFLVQVFLFYKEQLIALSGLAVNILVLIVLRYLIREEVSTKLGAKLICPEKTPHKEITSIKI